MGHDIRLTERSSTKRLCVCLIESYRDKDGKPKWRFIEKLSRLEEIKSTNLAALSPCTKRATRWTHAREVIGPFVCSLKSVKNRLGRCALQLWVRPDRACPWWHRNQTVHRIHHGIYKIIPTTQPFYALKKGYALGLRIQFYERGGNRADYATKHKPTPRPDRAVRSVLLHYRYRSQAIAWSIEIGNDPIRFCFDVIFHFFITVPTILFINHSSHRYSD